MARKNFNPGTLHAPLPAVMVTVGDMENSNILTVAWTGILSTSPARTYISVRPSRHSHKFLCNSGEFVINLTTESLAYATDYAGIYTGAKVDKFEKLSLHKEKSEKVAPPTIKESPLSLECKVFEVLHFGTHDVFMADILNISCDERILDSKGRICLDRANLMAYAHGEYFALGKKLGKFGFSTGKKAKTAFNKGSVNISKSEVKPKNITDKSSPMRKKMKGARKKNETGRKNKQ